MKTKKSQALERIITLMNESFDAEDIMKLAIAYSVVKHGVILPDWIKEGEHDQQGSGAPMTDKAVDMVMERLEALHSETKTD